MDMSGDKILSWEMVKDIHTTWTNEGALESIVLQLCIIQSKGKSTAAMEKNIFYNFSSIYFFLNTINNHQTRYNYIRW